MKHVTHQIQAWLSAELTPAEAAAMETHLRQCSACAQKAAAARSTWDLLAALEEPTPPARESVWPEVREMTFGRGPTSSWFFGGGRLAQSSLATAALAAGLVLGILLPGSGNDLVGGEAEALAVDDAQLETLWLDGSSWESGLTEFESAWFDSEEAQETDPDSSDEGTGK